MSAPCPQAARLIVAALAVGLSWSPAHADDRAARVLDAVRASYRDNPIDELLTIEVRGQGSLADVSEGRLRLRLDGLEPAGPPPDPQSPPPSAESTDGPEAARLLDLTVGPVRTSATASGVTVLHATDPDRYVGRAIEALTLEELERVIPSIPLPQIALAIGDSAGDTLHIPSILPPLTLHEIARGQTTITLTGRDGPVAATLVIARDGHRVQRFEATVPAASGWYDLVITVEQAVDAEAPDRAALPLTPPDVAERHQVSRVADLRPRGLVLVPEADLGWLPIHPADGSGPSDLGTDRGEGSTLAALLAARGPMAVAFLALPAGDPATGPGGLDPAWVDQVRQVTLLLDAARGDRWSLVLLFDPSARRSISMDRIDATLRAAGIDTPWAWVDGRTVALERALPRIDPALAAVKGDGTVLDIGQIPADETSRAALSSRLHDALAGSP